MIVGFTGTRNGMTEEQKLRLARFLEDAKLSSPYQCALFHGACHGADLEAAAIAAARGFNVVPFPRENETPEANKARDRLIVAGSDILVAAPSGWVEITRGSGTWYTMREGRRQDKRVYVVWPNGELRVWHDSPERVSDGAP